MKLRKCQCEICLSEDEHPDKIKHHYINLFITQLNEKQKRLFVAVEAKKLGYGGISKISIITGIDRKTISRGINELDNNLLEENAVKKIRESGGGRKLIEKKTPKIETEILNIVESDTAGNPTNSKLWIRKSLRNIRSELLKLNYNISPPTISRILKKSGYSLKSNIKEKEVRANNPNRNAQFKYIKFQIRSCIFFDIAVISIDTKKKELIGNFKNNGQQWCLIPEVVNVHDFPSDSIGKANPYGIYELNRNRGFINVGISNDTPEFAVDSIQRWWELFGRTHYRKKQLLILADCGGSNSYRSNLFKKYIQEKLCDKYGLEVTLNHYPPGCSKWNPIEHRLFSEVSKNWSGKPLRSYEEVLSYIKGTKTSTGLIVDAFLDTTYYEKGKKVSKSEYSSLNLSRFDFLCPDLNYTLKPRKMVQQTFSFYG